MGKWKLTAIFSMVSLSLLITGSNLPAIAYKNPLPVSQQSSAPKIADGLIKGNKLLLTGENFDAATMVMINGRMLTPAFDSSSPHLLVIKKAFKKVAPGSVADIQAQNASGQISEKFPFFVGKTITFEDAGKTITLAVGEKVQARIVHPPYHWSPRSLDESILVMLAEAEKVETAQGIFQALRRGTTKLEIVGDPCPGFPCGAPAIFFEVNIVVE